MAGDFFLSNYESARAKRDAACTGFSCQTCLRTNEKKIIGRYIRAADETVLVRKFHEPTIKYTSDNSKLSREFQRLRKVQDFTGTVVRFTMVKRTIGAYRRHVWTEGKGDEGATFYFHNSQT